MQEVSKIRSLFLFGDSHMPDPAMSPIQKPKLPMCKMCYNHTNTVGENKNK